MQLPEVYHIRLRILVFLLFLCPLGWMTKFYHGIGAQWSQNYFGDILYPVFWGLVLLMIFPKWDIRKIAIGLFLLCTGLEFLQLVHAPFLETCRSYFVGRALLGASFNWWDIGYYAAGALLLILTTQILITPNQFSENPNEAEQ